MNTALTITLTDDTGHKETTPFLSLTLAVRYAESVANNKKNHIVSVLMQGPEGEREFLQENTLRE